MLEVDWPAVVAGVGTYGEWESPPSETSVIASGYMVNDRDYEQVLAVAYAGGPSNLRGFHSEVSAADGSHALQPHIWWWQDARLHIDNDGVGSRQERGPALALPWRICLQLIWAWLGLVVRAVHAHAAASFGPGLCKDCGCVRPNKQTSTARQKHKPYARSFLTYA